MNDKCDFAVHYLNLCQTCSYIIKLMINSCLETNITLTIIYFNLKIEKEFSFKFIKCQNKCM
jgi:hypothetical protein